MRSKLNYRTGLIIIFFFLFLAQNSFAAKPSFLAASSSSIYPIPLNALPVNKCTATIFQRILEPTSKKFEITTGKHLNFIEKIKYKFLQSIIRKRLTYASSNNNDAKKADKMATLSMICAFGMFIPIIGVASGIAAILLGRYALRNDTTRKWQALFGIIFPSVILLAGIIFVIIWTSGGGMWGR